MDEMSLFLDIKNEKELLRIYKNNANKAKTDSEKANWISSAEKVKNEIDQLEAKYKK